MHGLIAAVRAALSGPHGREPAVQAPVPPAAAQDTERELAAAGFIPVHSTEQEIEYIHRLTGERVVYNRVTGAIVDAW